MSPSRSKAKISAGIESDSEISEILRPIKSSRPGITFAI